MRIGTIIGDSLLFIILYEAKFDLSKSFEQKNIDECLRFNQFCFFIVLKFVVELIGIFVRVHTKKLNH